MKILYVGQLWEGGTCLERMKTLQSFGHELVPFDTSPWTSTKNRLFGSLAQRMNWGPTVWDFNKTLVNRSQTIGCVDLIWVDKGRWVYPETLDLLKQCLDSPALHYTPDPQLVFHKSRYFERCIPKYDWVVTTKTFEREMYRDFGAKNILFVLQGFDSRFTRYQSVSQEHTKWCSDVCFVGHYEKHYAETLMAASDVTEQLKIWGPGWTRYKKQNAWARPYVYGNGVWGEDYLRALSHSKIGLGFLSKWIPETTTTRSFEIPAIGTFLLAERTDDHLALFEEGKEAEFFGSKEEMKDKIRFYLDHENTRKKIAIAGRERCLRSAYASAEQLSHVLAKILSNMKDNQ
jgi:spore maturation protein CgeB